MPIAQEPTLSVSADGRTVSARGTWQVHALASKRTMKAISACLNHVREDQEVQWDLSEVHAMDHIGAQLLWGAWGYRRPARLQLSNGQDEFFKRIESAGKLELPHQRSHRFGWITSLGFGILHFYEHLQAFLRLVGQVTLDTGRFLANPMRGPWREISANIFHAGFQALGITALVGLLIGVVFSYLSAQQLRNFGGDIFLVNLLGISIIRELGPLLAAILVAGRSGSSITAQLGVMRVTEELDAMLVMGIPHGFRLILPKVLALAVSMPLLVIWTDASALLGGMVAAKMELNLSMHYFLQRLPEVVSATNYMIGLLKGAVFGMLIALVSCHFGLRIEPNTESLGRGTTTSVVTAITVVILADAVFAIVFNGVGY